MKITDSNKIKFLMSRSIRLLSIPFLPALFATALCLANPASAQGVPEAMTYQGRLTDANSATVPDGNGYEIEVRLWSASTGGTLLWGTRYTGVPLRNGAFNLILGPGGTSLEGAVTTDLKKAFNAAPVHLAVTMTKNAAGAAISAATEVLPRQQIFSTPFAFRADTSENSLRLNGQLASYYVPPGTVVAYAGQTAPAGWLMCDGSALASTAYPDLFAAIGTQFGTGGAATFKLPDLRGRLPLGTSPAAPAGNPISQRTLAQQGGEENHVLTIAEMPSHGHEERYGTGQSSSKTGPYVAGANFAASAERAIRTDNFDTQSAAPIVPSGGGAAHNNMPPFLVLNYIIKY